MVIIRDALSQDAKRIAQVHVSSWQHAYLDLMPADYLASLSATLPQREAYWARTIEGKDADILVAEVEGDVIGWLSLGPCRDEDTSEAASGEVMAIYVLAEYWSKGIGAQLWQTGFKRLLIKVINASPYGFYLATKGPFVSIRVLVEQKSLAAVARWCVVA